MQNLCKKKCWSIIGFSYSDIGNTAESALGSMAVDGLRYCACTNFGEFGIDYVIDKSI